MARHASGQSELTRSDWRLATWDWRLGSCVALSFAMSLILQAGARDPNASARVVLSADNYQFTPNGVDEEGLVVVTIRPLRKDRSGRDDARVVGDDEAPNRVIE